MLKVAVLQSNYIPWKGYFDIIHDVDTFVFYDDVQYTKNDWRNRNKIKTQNGATWLTIPAGTDLSRLICEVKLEDKHWAAKHFKSICQYYCKAPYFHLFRQFLEHVYLEREWQTLSELNIYLITKIAREFLGIKTEFMDSRVLNIHGKRLERLLDLLTTVGTDIYVTGPSAGSYIIPDEFTRAGIELVYKDYSGYPEYPQFYTPFEHGVSIVDLLFHTGQDAPWYIWGWRDNIRNCNPIGDCYIQLPRDRSEIL